MVIGIEFLQGLGYLGAFLSGFFSSFTLFLPSPTFVVVFLLASKLNPLLLGIAGGLGAAIGETIGYGIGRGAGALAEKKKESYAKWVERLQKFFRTKKPDVAVFIFAALPVVPFDIVGLLCGATKYDFRRFLIATSLGKIVKYLIIAYAGFYGMSWLLSWVG